MDSGEIRKKYDEFWAKSKHEPMPACKYLEGDRTIARLFTVAKGMGLKVKAEMRFTVDPEEPPVIVLCVDNGTTVHEGSHGDPVPLNIQAARLLRGLGAS